MFYPRPSHEAYPTLWTGNRGEDRPKTSWNAFSSIFFNLSHSLPLTQTRSGAMWGPFDWKLSIQILANGWQLFMQSIAKFNSLHPPLTVSLPLRHPLSRLHLSAIWWTVCHKQSIQTRSSMTDCDLQYCKTLPSLGDYDTGWRVWMGDSSL